MSLAALPTALRPGGIPPELVAAPVGHRRWGTVSARDVFSRGDSASTLGSLETGQAWNTSIGNGSGSVTFGVSGHRAYEAAQSGSPTERIAWFETGSPDGQLDADVVLPSAGGNVGFVVRFVDSANYLFARPNATTGKAEILQSLGGARTVPGSGMVAAGAIVASGAYHFAVRFVGPWLFVFVNGVQALRLLNTNFVSSTKHGLCTSNVAASTPFWANLTFSPEGT